LTPSHITFPGRCSPFARVGAAGAGTVLTRGGVLDGTRLAPALLEPVHVARLNTTPARGPRGAKRVLIVEDDDLTREMLATILQEEGYLTEGVANGREALATLEAAMRPDVILLDLLMPVMSGWEFRAAQVEDPRLASIPVVIISATEQSPAETEPLLQPMAHLRKPITVEELLDVVARC
jgi:CheY-like chemotaxis protein